MTVTTQADSIDIYFDNRLYATYIVTTGDIWIEKEDLTTEEFFLLTDKLKTLISTYGE